jgi:hypothetical protein
LVPIARLIVDPAMQVRTRLNSETVERYAEALRQSENPERRFPPVQVAILGQAWHVVDGFHRIEAARAVGLERIAVEARPAATLEEARWRAGAANLTHGLPLRRPELREVFRRFVRAGGHRRAGVRPWRGMGPEPPEARRRRFLSYREMATALGGIVPTRTLIRWMHADFPSVARALKEGEGRGGLREPKAAQGGADEAAKAALAGLHAFEAHAAAAARSKLWRGEIEKALEATYRRFKEGRGWAPGDDEPAEGDPTRF